MSREHKYSATLRLVLKSYYQKKWLISDDDSEQLVF